MYLEPTEVYTDMDPRLQVAVDRQQRGMTTMATASSEEDEIGVLALVDDVEAFAGRDDVRLGTVIGEVDGARLVTARVPIGSLDTVRRSEGVRSMKSAQVVQPVLTATVPEIHCAPDALPPGSLAAGGAGVVVGVIDYGADFAHKNLIRPDGSTRFGAIWDQRGPKKSDGPFGYGRRINAREIDQALSRRDPYEALGYEPGPADDPSHGTHVSDIAAGNGRGTGAPGVAPHADIIFVEQAASDIEWKGEGVLEDFFGDSVKLLEAAKFLFDEAGDRPCVINISLGTNGGPHDGTSLVEKGFDALIAAKPNRAIVIAAGNAHNDGIHIAGRVPAGGSVDVRWNIPENLKLQSELELWYDGADEFEVELITPGRESLGRVGLGRNARVQANDGKALMFLSHRAKDPNNGDNVVGIFLERRVPDGTWTVRLHGKKIADGGFHAWIERSDKPKATFENADGTFTVGSISCGRLPIVVGSYDAHKPGRPLSGFSAAGPTRDGRQKPDISAPGHDVVAACSSSGTGVVTMSGTSMAAPAVTGVVALVLAEAHARGLSLDAETLRRIVLESGRSDPPSTNEWHDRYGHGRVDAAEAVRAVQKMAGH